MTTKRSAQAVLQEGQTYKLSDGTIFKLNVPETITKESQILLLESNSRFAVTINNPESKEESEAPAAPAPAAKPAETEVPRRGRPSKQRDKS